MIRAVTRSGAAIGQPEAELRSVVVQIDRVPVEPTTSAKRFRKSE